MGGWAAAEDRSGTIVLSVEIRQDLAEVAACTSEATDGIAAALKDAAAEQHATAVLTR